MDQLLQRFVLGFNFLHVQSVCAFYFIFLSLKLKEFLFVLPRQPIPSIRVLVCLPPPGLVWSVNFLSHLMVPEHLFTLLEQGCVICVAYSGGRVN